MKKRSSSATILVVCALLICSPLIEAKRSLGGGGRKTSGGGHTTRRQQETHVTKPTYNTNSGNSHADQAKLSYPNYNSQPNRPANNAAPASNTNNQPIGWNVGNNNQQQSHAAAGPPPVYSASNVAGGAKTNINEPPPSYQKPNYGAPPPTYNQATGTHYGSASYPAQVPAGATYHNPNNVPQGATFYNNPAQVPGGYPMGGGGYHAPSGGYPMGGYHAPGGGGYYPANSVPAGASFYQAGSSLPAGAVMYSAPPQQTSSGLGFGSGLAAGAIGGAILGHALTPTHTRVVEQAPAPAGNAAGGGDRVIIINNSGQPINATDANGVTVINAGETPAPAAPGAPGAPAASSEAPAPLAPMAPIVPMAPDMNATTPMPGAMPDSTSANPEQQPPPPGGIICVPVRINATDPNDATKMVEVEQIACYPAPPPVAAPAMNATDPAAPPPAEGAAPLAPMQPAPSGGSQQLQQATLVGDQSVKQADSGAFAAANNQYGLMSLIICFLAKYLVAY